MLRRFPHIAVASLVVLTIDLSAYSGSTPTDQQMTSQGLNTSEAAQGFASPAQTRKADPDLASKLLTGEVTGVTPRKLDELPDLDSALKGAGTQIESTGCLNTGIAQLETGATTVAQIGVVSLLLSSGSTAPSKHKEYAQRCPSTSGTMAGSPVKQNIEQQQAPAVEDVNDLVAATVSSESTVDGKAVNTKAYLLIGGAGGNIVVAQSMILKGEEPSSETVIEPFKVQVGKIKG